VEWEVVEDDVLGVVEQGVSDPVMVPVDIAVEG
jgi:hypothetical protein